MGLGLLAVGVEYLHLVTALHADAAIAVARHRFLELGVQIAIAKLLFAADVLLVLFARRGHTLIIHRPVAGLGRRRVYQLSFICSGLPSNKMTAPSGGAVKSLGLTGMLSLANDCEAAMMQQAANAIAPIRILYVICDFSLNGVDGVGLERNRRS